MKLPSDTVVPPGSFKYLVPETSQLVPQSGSTSLYGCIAQVKAHYIANRLVVPSGLRERIEDYNCRKAPPGFCVEDSGQTVPPTELPDVRGTAIEQVLQGAKTIAGWLKEGSVPAEQARARAEVCFGCKYHGDEKCPSCKRGLLSQLKNFVAATLARPATEWEEKLRACGICGCALKLKVFVKLETIVAHSQKKQIAAFPEWCWIKKELS